MNKKIYLIIAGLLVFTFLFSFVSSAEVVSTSEPTVCCEKTVSGLFCQDVPSTSCAAGSRQVPTSCESTSFCKQGTCVDSKEGICSDNTPELVCNKDAGVWFAEDPIQCSLGCCVLGDQAAFVTQARCKALSGNLGLKTNYRADIIDETQCVLSVAGQEKGACVFASDFQKTCRFTTRQDCQAGLGVNTTGTSGEFFEGKLCTAEELGTNCALTTETMIVPGKDEIYWKDSCGNPANIYDASKVDEKEYWSNIKSKAESCNPNDSKGNGNSKTCGNCNYLLGSFARPVSSETSNPSYGDFICADLNCKDTSNGNAYKHGESWCVNDDEGSVDNSDNSVGSKFFKHLCINGEEVVETCADFRQETCIEDKIETSLGEFSQAACRVNRWQDCFVQDTQIDCENTDRRDCLWEEGSFNVVVLNKTQSKGVCIPKNSPGLKFWEGEEALNVCAQANAQCIVTFEKSLFGGGEKCSDNCECLEDSWEKKHADLCSALGDCGPNINWVGSEGYKEGYKVTEKSVKSKD